MCSTKETKEVYKLKCLKLQYKVNEEEGVVTAIETFFNPIFTQKTPRTFTTIGVAKVNKEAGEVFNVETGKKVARAKAEKEAFIKFKLYALEYKKGVSKFVQKLENTIDKMNTCIQHQKEYIKSF